MALAPNLLAPSSQAGRRGFLYDDGWVEDRRRMTLNKGASENQGSRFGGPIIRIKIFGGLSPRRAIDRK